MISAIRGSKVFSKWFKYYKDQSLFSNEKVAMLEIEGQFVPNKQKFLLNLVETSRERIQDAIIVESMIKKFKN